VVPAAWFRAHHRGLPDYANATANANANANGNVLEAQEFLIPRASAVSRTE